MIHSRTAMHSFLRFHELQRSIALHMAPFWLFHPFRLRVVLLVPVLVDLQDHVIAGVVLGRVEVYGRGYNLHRSIEFIGFTSVRGYIGVGCEIVVSFVHGHVVGYPLVEIGGGLPSGSWFLLVGLL